MYVLLLEYTIGVNNKRIEICQDNSYKMCKINVEMFHCGRSFQAKM